jgi:hypothetical protein
VFLIQSAEVKAEWDQRNKLKKDPKEKTLRPENDSE